VDERSMELYAQGESILRWLNDAYEHRDTNGSMLRSKYTAEIPFLGCKLVPYRGLDNIGELKFLVPISKTTDKEYLFGIEQSAIPYTIFKCQIGQQKE
jgi:hypothetical protein